MYSILMLPGEDKLANLAKLSDFYGVQFAFVLENVCGRLEDPLIQDAARDYRLQRFALPLPKLITRILSF